MTSIIVLHLIHLVMNGLLMRVSGLNNNGNGLNQDGYSWENFRNKLGNVVDRRKLLGLFALICPVDEICSLTGEPNYYGYEPYGIDARYIFKSCKSCDCYDECMTTDSCCPDLPAAYMKHECVDTTLYRSPWATATVSFDDYHKVKMNSEEDDFSNLDALTTAGIFYKSNTWNLMVSSCPNGSTKEEVMYCNAGKTVPVSGMTSQISYRNKYCASCNHDDKDLVNWKVSFLCLEEMEGTKVRLQNPKFVKKMELYECVVKYDPQQTSDDEENYPPSYKCNYTPIYMYKLGRCNVTGLWSEYDPDIEWACENLNLAYKWRYKNVFCYICNPSLVSTHSEMIYDHCNMTGLWKKSKYDGDVENRCLTFPSIRRLAPFKNVYCIICNGYRRLHRNDIAKEYELSQINEPYMKESRPVPPTSFYLKIESPNILEKSREVFKFFAPNFQTYEYELKQTEFKPKPSENTSFLFDAYFQACGYDNLCKNYSSLVGHKPTKTYCQRCTCESECVANDDCCIDLIMERLPYTCMEEPKLFTIEHSSEDFSTDKGASMKVINKCLKTSDEELVRRCEIDHYNRSDILAYIPVTDNGDYKNIYCLMCNELDPEPTFKFELICNHYFETALTKTFAYLYEMARKYCKIQVAPVSYDRRCGNRGIDTEDSTIIASCNETGLWFSYDENIAAGCDAEGNSPINFLPLFTVLINETNITTFKNYFCFLCNPHTSLSMITEIYDSCSFDFHLEELCKETDLVESWLPYKNVYCYLCNVVPKPNKIPLTPHVTPASMDTQMDPSIGFTYRMLFSLTPEEWSSYPEGNDPNAVCIHGLSYDYSAHSCRVVFCSEHRVLVSDECIHISRLIPTGEDSMTINARFNDVNIPILGWLYRLNKNVFISMDEFESSVSLKFLCDRLVSLMEKSLSVADYNVRFANCHVLYLGACAEENRNWNSEEPVRPLVYVFYNRNITFHLDFVLYDNVDVEQVMEYIRKDLPKNFYHFEEIGLKADFNISFEETINNSTTENVADNACDYHRVYRLPHEELSYAVTTIPNIADSQDYAMSKAKIMSCLQIQLKSNEFYFNVTANTVSIHEGTKVLNANEFEVIDNNSIRVCKKDYDRISKQPVTELSLLHRVHNVFSYVFTMTSLFCLLVTFITYCIFPDLRTIPGKNIMSLCLSLFVAQGCLQFSSFIMTHESICVPFAILTHYSWLATFCAMNVCSFHMYRIFYNKRMVVSKGLRQFEQTKYYLIYTYTFPFAVVILNVAIHLGVSKGEFTGYGKYVCFLSDTPTIVLTFIVPAGLIFIANFVFFLLAFQAIRTSSRIACTVRDRREYFIYLKLCTLTGFSWPLQIIDSFLPLSAFSFVAVFINALQGFYIFSSYVCNERIWKLLFRMWTGKSVSSIERNISASRSNAILTTSTNISLQTKKVKKEM